MAGINKILVANRGEIAVRVIATAREMGFRTVAVYSDADAGALHVGVADQAVCIGPAPAGNSYLATDHILDAARRAGADAIHPGYGFLSENADFARACESAGLLFIGPGADSIELMGSKRLSKIAMIEAGVPCIPGYQGEDQSEEALHARALEIGFPLMIKASAGGGGRGMRLVFEEGELAAQIRTARSEAEGAFGSGELILERAVLEPRHIEIQVFADNHGNVVYLGERDCSIQRRHQKVVEEAPSPFVDPALRQSMGEAAVNAARACGYRGAGTVEFLVDNKGNFHFLEMNTRLQVEHPVTELVTGLDLVAWQLRVAAGEPLPLTQDEIVLRGHAMEVRLYAEDTRNGFMPQTGEILLWEVARRAGIRTDHGIRTGQVISPHYDPMIAKIISHGDDRPSAIRRLASAVQDTCLLGVNNNKQFLHNVLRHPVFGEGEATTSFIEQHFSSDPSMDRKTPDAGTLARAAVLFFARNRSHWEVRSAWPRPQPQIYVYRLACEDEIYQVTLHNTDNQFLLTVGDQSIELQLVALDSNRCWLIEDGLRESTRFVTQGNTLALDDGTGHFLLHDVTHQPASRGGRSSGDAKACMDGAIVEILVAKGDTVEAGQTLVVLEAMKMQHALSAGVSGTVEAVNCTAGQQVKTNQILVTVNEPSGETVS
ncbi:acetyl/propionyl/methylcrotonyl-CoA carboxylase subunit alpha [Kineobactrum salinum]|uniref:Biotin carboxylase n=1 Tax=Kineobactrum salinum TaxID=2708301 RepID=A0A6C0U6B1_9GAMM|nr:acetyl/propionyl/methylcrotonyl-CoA carboxylase subunit alpha [Kineobactrum salinum]QIB66889.1 acetyl/propionyl/methylcrotonyl-CoA carboxylase subunit alpha [Kineobactrum salinum]